MKEASLSYAHPDFLFQNLVANTTDPSVSVHTLVLNGKTQNALFKGDPGFKEAPEDKRGRIKLQLIQCWWLIDPPVSVADFREKCLFILMASIKPERTAVKDVCPLWLQSFFWTQFKTMIVWAMKS